MKNSSPEPASVTGSGSQSTGVYQPLMAVKEVSPMCTWSEWLELWNQSEDFFTLMGLLETGFLVKCIEKSDDVENPQWIQRLCHYLEVADGHCFLASSTGRSQTLPEFKEQLSSVRVILAKKALSMLCTNLFGLDKENESDRYPLWVYQVLKPFLLDKLIWFFRVNNGRVFNLSGHNNKEERALIVNFLREFCQLFWKFHIELFIDRHYASKVAAALRERQHQMIPLLEVFDLFPLFIKQGTRGQSDWFVLDGKSVVRLQELVMAKEIYFPKGVFRKPRNLVEALFGGTTAAALLYNIKTMEALKKGSQKRKSRPLIKSRCASKRLPKK